MSIQQFDAQVKGLTMEEYERQINRRLWKRRIAVFGEICGFLLMVAVLSAVCYVGCIVF